MPTPDRLQKMQAVASRRQQGVVVFEDIHDPHNVEAALRSLDAFGFQRACIIFEQEKAFDPRRVGKASSSSANKWLDFAIYRSTEACIADLRREQFEVIATVVAPGAEDLLEASFMEAKVAVMLGNEHRGLSERAVELADRRVTIPMAGMVRSLNLSVTTALFLYEITRQRRARGFERYLLPEADRSALARDFLER